MIRLNRSFTFLFLMTVALLLTSAGNPPPQPASSEILADLKAALTTRLRSGPAAQSITFDLFTPELDTAFTSPDGKVAVLWLALRDDAGRLLATEPGLVLARLSNLGWQVLLPGDPGWKETLSSLPDGMLPLEQSPAPKNIAVNSAPSLETLTGYYLPYAAGTARWLEGSISHFQSIPELGYPSCSIEYCHYAYDFTDSWHFPILASKDGAVVASRDSCSDGSTNCTNFIVLYNASDLAYQIYLHLANNTIPDRLTSGTAVRRGQYLGDSDDTGYSTSQHVHFMVTDSIWVGGDGYYWGRSMDIRFADVGINNGIPRNCYEVTHFAIYDGASDCLGNKSDPRNPANDWFISGNTGAYPPSGKLSQPVAGEIVASGTNPLMDVTATANDDVSVTAVRLVARINNQWVEIGPKVTQTIQPGTYDWDVNLCSVAPLNGPLEVALRIWDHEGNMTAAVDPRTIQVDHACPPPTSQLKPAEGFDSTAVRLSWDAVSAEAGIGSFELQWRTEPGAWDAANTLTLTASQRSTWFIGQLGGSYAFRLRALDTNGQPEAWPAGNAAETSSILPVTCTLDALEPNDDPSQTSLLTLGTDTPSNLCGPGNPDWFKVVTPVSKGYLVNVLSQGGGAAVKLTIYSEDGATVLASIQSAGPGQGIVFRYQPAAPGGYKIEVEPLTANLAGTGAIYSVAVSEARDVFLPLVAR